MRCHCVASTIYQEKNHPRSLYFIGKKMSCQSWSWLHVNVAWINEVNWIMMYLTQIIMPLRRHLSMRLFRNRRIPDKYSFESWFARGRLVFTTPAFRERRQIVYISLFGDGPNCGPILLIGVCKPWWFVHVYLKVCIHWYI